MGGVSHFSGQQCRRMRARNRLRRGFEPVRCGSCAGPAVERTATASGSTAAAAAHLDLPADSIRPGLLPGQLIRSFGRIGCLPPLSG